MARRAGDDNETDELNQVGSFEYRQWFDTTFMMDLLRGQSGRWKGIEIAGNV